MSGVHIFSTGTRTWSTPPNRSGFQRSSLSLQLYTQSQHDMIDTICLWPVASTRVQGWGDEPCEPTVRLPDWSELVASYSRMKTAWGWANGGQPILVCYIQKYVIILAGIFLLTSPPTKILGGCVPGIPGGVDASGNDEEFHLLLSAQHLPDINKKANRINETVYRKFHITLHYKRHIGIC